MRIYALFTAMLLNWGMVFGQSDPVIMKIAGQPVSRSEFEYSYNKNNSASVIDKKDVNGYVDLFINYRLKVKAALDAHLDTLTSFKKEFQSYRDQQIRPSFISDNDIEVEAHKLYSDAEHRIDNEGGMIRPAHIFMPLRQKDSQVEADRIKNRMDSIYTLLQKGADFATLAKKYSEDRSSAQNGGLLPWLIKGQAFKEFEDVAYTLKKGQYSKPFRSPAGYHIIMMVDRHNYFPYDSLKNNIHNYIETRGIREQLINHSLDSIAKTMASGTTREQILNMRAAEMSAKDNNLKYLIQEYHDGLLLYDISNRMVWDKAARDEKGLTHYFRKHKKNYAWNQPHFKGIAYHVKRLADVQAVKNSIKGKPFDKWADILRHTFNNDSIIRVRVEKGIFKKGDSPLVDKEVFHNDTVTVHSLKAYPIDATYGKVLKKGPESYEDVKAQVIDDYQNELEKKWVKELRKTYKVEIYPNVLATVNKH